ncbi:MAG TPA: protein-glutamate O-methyltransferase CheR [Bacilli bacterium]
MEHVDLDFAEFVKKVKAATSIDLSLYKEAQMKRRLTAFRLKKGFDTFSAFFAALVKDDQLLYEFFDRMTINVSEFWRNSNRWTVLAEKILPQLLKKNPRLKCWSAACSTGEEPYTLAMIMAEKNALLGAKIIASDIDAGVLERARAGIYGERSLKEMPDYYVRKYFSAENGMFRVHDTLRRAVDFRKGNLLNDRFENDFDLIICRNVVIYFTEEAKHLLYQKFSNALKRGGILFVGSTEQIFQPGKYGLEVAESFFYRKI